MAPHPIPLLFQAIPKDLFRPLASLNREHYWRLLVLLYGRFFGPEADVPPAAGWDRRDVLTAVEQLLENDDPWQAEEEEASNSTVNARAHMYVRRLAEAGWLLEERSGMAVVVSMPVAVTRLMELLYGLIEFTPPAVGAKMRSIEGALLRVATSAQPGDDLEEAAGQARALVAGMGSIGLRVRELMRSLTAEVTTAQALKQIFGEYIGKVYIADYAQLTGADHPLARKAAVLVLVHEIAYTDRRDHLLRWYLDNRTHGNLEEAQARLERSLRHIQDLARLQDFLDRLESDLRRMNRRMLALIDYRLHAPSQMEMRLTRALAAVCNADERIPRPPVGAGQLLSGDLLYRPRVRRPPIPRVSDVEHRLTAEQEARMRLRRQARDTRRVQSRDIYLYLDRTMGAKLQIRASELPIESIKDFRVVQTLASLALNATTLMHSRNGNGITGKLPRYAFRAAPGAHVKSGYLDMPDFYITKVR